MASKWRGVLKRILAQNADSDFVQRIWRNSPDYFSLDSHELAANIFEIANYQGLSDAAVSTWLERNGKPDFKQLDRLIEHQECSAISVASNWSLCNFTHTSQSCQFSALKRACVIPAIPARNARLAKLAVALVKWSVSLPLEALKKMLSEGRSSTEIATYFVSDLTALPGISNKVANMIASDVLVSCGEKYPLLLEAGLSCVVVDIHVHNVLKRSGALKEQGAEHAFGSGCYKLGRCRDIIITLSNDVSCPDRRKENTIVAPRRVQHAIWRHGAVSEGNICNALKIPMSKRCAMRECSAFSICPKC